MIPAPAHHDRMHIPGGDRFVPRTYSAAGLAHDRDTSLAVMLTHDLDDAPKA